MPIFQVIKISGGTNTARIHGNYHECSDCFEYPKKSLLKSSYPKKYLPKFSYPKKFLDHPCHLKSGAPPPWVMDPGTYKHFILTFVKQTPQSSRWTLFLGYSGRIDSINKVAVTLRLNNLLINCFSLLKSFPVW